MCVGCDTTNRTRQGLAKQNSWPWLEGKSFVGSAVLGTWTEYDPRPKRITLSVNGELRQDSNTDLMVHSVDDLIDTLASWYGHLREIIYGQGLPLELEKWSLVT